jgi:hypothetical protein
MALVTGPELDSIVKEMREWYFATRKVLIDALEENYPYRSVKLSPDEQLERFQSMTQEDWQGTLARLQRKYAGQDDANQRVQEEIDKFRKHITMLASRRQINA